MTKTLKKLFGIPEKKEPKTDFSVFFHTASSREKKKVLTDVMRKASADQKAVVDLYRQKIAS